ncbi:hypothetical protein HYU94_00010 [Candidatus Daviesbacteria bacterium]|nr:hypothetical protein [Candidatus Daviesbacteria bacterium]
MSELRETSQPFLLERINLPQGQLVLRQPLPKDLAPNFKELLISENPWYQEGEMLSRRTREVKRFNIAGTDIVIKKAVKTGQDLAAMPKQSTSLAQYTRAEIRANTPTAQMIIIDKAVKKYKEAYGENLPIEQMFGFYIDKASTQKYMIFKGYESTESPDIYSPEGVAILDLVNQIGQKLRGLGFYLGDGPQYLVIKDPQTETGLNIVLIDTERWAID